MINNSTNAVKTSILRCFLLLLFNLITQPLLAQAPLKAWDKRYGGSDIDFLTCQVVTADGGYLLGGWSYSGISGEKTDASRGASDFWLLKINADGSRAWDKTYGGDGGEDMRAIIKTSDGGYLLGGSSGSGISGDKTTPSRGESDYWIVKINADGSKAWDRSFGGSGDDQLLALSTTADGNYLLGGSSNSGKSGDKSTPSNGGYDYWVVKIDIQGNKVWDKSFGGNAFDELAAFVEAPNGDFLLGGYSRSNAGGNKTHNSKGWEDYWVVRINADGSKIWDKTFGGLGDYIDKLTAVTTTADGGFILGGYSSAGISGDKTQATRGWYDYWLIKINADGVKVWDKSYGGNAGDELTSLIATKDGGYLLGGHSVSGISGDKTESWRDGYDYWIVKINSSGDKEWDKTFGGSSGDQLYAMSESLYGGYLLGGLSASDADGDKSESSRGGLDFWVVKVNLETVSFTSQPSSKVITGGQNTSFSVIATGKDLKYQWQVSKDGGSTFTDVSNGLGYSGANSATLSITKAPISMSGYRYRVQVSNGSVSTSSTALLTVNVPAFDNSRTWQVVGGQGFSEGMAFYPSIALAPDGTPYMAYTDVANGEKAIVKKFDGNSWVTLGPGWITSVKATGLSLAITSEGVPYIAYSDWANGNKATVQKFNGTNWVPVGKAGFSPDPAGYVSLVFDKNGAPHIGLGGSQATVMKFNGTSWVLVGPQRFSLSAARHTELAFDNNGSPYVAYTDLAIGDKIAVKKYDGSSWVNVGGPGFSAGEAYSLTIAVDGNGTPYVAYSDWVNGDKAAVKRFNGNNWVTVGPEWISSGSSGSTQIVLDASGTPYVAFDDGVSNGKSTVLRFNGTSWIAVGSAGFSPKQSSNTMLALDTQGIPYIAYGGDHKATVMKFALAPPVISVQPASKTITGGQNTSFTVTALGTNLTYQWQISRDGGKTFSSISNGLGYSGATSSSLSITNAPISMNGFQYRVQVSNGSVSTSASVTLTVNVPAFDNNRVWQIAGKPGISNGETIYTSLAISTSGIPYVAFGDVKNDTKASVMKLGKSGWENVGTPGFSSGEATGINIVIDRNGIPYVAYQDHGNGGKATVMRYKDNIWAVVGTAGFSEGPCYNTSIAIGTDGTPYVAYLDWTVGGKATVRKFDGSKWIPVGSAQFTAKETYGISIALDANNTPFVSYKDDTNGGRVSAMKYNGNKWVSIGSINAVVGSSPYTKIVVDANGTPYLAYVDKGYGEKAVVKKYDGNHWVNVGGSHVSTGFAGDINLALDYSGTPFIAYGDGAKGGITVRKYAGNGWLDVGRAGFSAGGRTGRLSLGLDTDGTPYVSFPDWSNDEGKATVMKFAVQLNAAPTNVVLSNATVKEDVAANTVIGTFTTTDADAGDTHNYTLVSGTGSTDNASFSIDGNKLVIKVAPDFEKKSSYSIRVRTSDGKANGTLEKAFTIEVIDLDEVAPTLTAVTIASNNSNASMAKVGDVVTVSLIASEPIKAPTVTIAGRPATVTAAAASTTQFTARYTMASGDAEGQIPFLISFQDEAGNNGAAASATTNGSKVVFDKARPGAAITSAVSGLTNSKPMLLTLTFSETVSGLEATDFTVANGSITKVSTADSKVYALEFTPQSNGTVTVTLPADKVIDGVGNGNTASNSWAGSYDGTRPTVTLSTSASASTNAAFTVTFTFSEAVTGFALNDIAFVNGVASEFKATSASVYTAKVSPTIQGTVSVSVGANAVQDAAGNGNTASSALIRTYDSVAPAGYGVAFNQNLITFSNQGAVSVKVTGAEVGVTYSYTITSAGGGTPVHGTGLVAAATFDINNINVTALADGQLTISLRLTDAASNTGSETTAKVNKNTRNLVGYTSPAAVHVPFLRTYSELSASLPATVEVIFSDNSKASVSVSWQSDGYNGAVAGSYELSGVMTLPSGMTNSSNIKVTITVVVTESQVPTAITLSRADLDESNAVGAVVGTLTSTDADVGDSHTYSLVVGEGSVDNASFTIEGDVMKAAQVFDYETKSSYSIRIRSTDRGGKTFEAVKVITINNVEETVTGIADEKNPMLRVYPNPANDYLLISLDKPMETVKLIDSRGSTVLMVRLNSQQARLNLEGLATGVYTAIITSKDKVYSKRVLVSK